MGATEPLAALAAWTGPPPSTDEWMEGRAKVLQYSGQSAAVVTVITVFVRPSELIPTSGGIVSTSAKDAMHCAVTAAADMAFHRLSGDVADVRQRVTTTLSDPAHHIDWRPGRIIIEGETVAARQATVLASATAAFTEFAHRAVFIGMAAALPGRLDDLGLTMSPDEP